VHAHCSACWLAALICRGRSAVGRRSAAARPSCDCACRLRRLLLVIERSWPSLVIKRSWLVPRDGLLSSSCCCRSACRRRGPTHCRTESACALRWGGRRTSGELPPHIQASVCCCCPHRRTHPALLLRHSWNHFAANINADILRQTADAMASNGLRGSGYEYLNLGAPPAAAASRWAV
jgi:hypothetical protein